MGYDFYNRNNYVRAKERCTPKWMEGCFYTLELDLKVESNGDILAFGLLRFVHLIFVSVAQRKFPYFYLLCVWFLGDLIFFRLVTSYEIK